MIPSTVIFQIQSFLILCVMIYGVTKARRDRRLHMKIMLGAILWDILLILQIELSRQAVATAMKVMDNPMMLKIHLFFAIGSVLLYTVMIYSGRRVYKGDHAFRAKHKALGLTTLVFRTMTLLTSYFAA